MDEITDMRIDQVFLTIVGNANVAEEGYGKPEKKKWWKRSKGADDSNQER